MNIWLLHHYAGGPGLGRHWRPFWLCDAWNRQGHQATVICATHHHLLHSEPRTAGLENIAEVDYWFVNTPAYQGNGLGRVQNMLQFGRQFKIDVPHLIEQRGIPDLIIASSPHLFHIPAARQVAKKLGAQFWVEIRDLWPCSLVELGLAKSLHPFILWLSLLERYAYRNAERLVSLLASAESYMSVRGLNAEKFQWVPNGISSRKNTLAAAKNNPPNLNVLDALHALKNEKKRVILYAGAFGPANAVEVIIAAARILAAQDASYHFVFVGSGISLPELRDSAADLANCTFMPETTPQVIQQALQLADCAVVSFHGSPLYHYGISPNKLFEYAQYAQRTVIACDARGLIGIEALVTTRCEPDKPEVLAEALAQACGLPVTALEERDKVLKQFHYDVLAERFLEDKTHVVC